MNEVYKLVYKLIEEKIEKKHIHFKMFIVYFRECSFQKRNRF